jgi:hypothetical protein
MKPLTAVVCCTLDSAQETAWRSLAQSPLVEALVLLCPPVARPAIPGVQILATDCPFSEQALGALLAFVRTPYLLLLPDGGPVEIGQSGLERLIEESQKPHTGIVYADYYEDDGGAKRLHPLIDYRPGSVRDDFAFGPIFLVSAEAARHAWKTHGLVPGVLYAGLYDLRLKMSIDRQIARVPAPLYTAQGTGSGRPAALFDYLDPRNRAVQKEMEQVFTDYLRKIGAYVPAARLRRYDAAGAPFPVEASVVIPVRDRAKTIAQAVGSALSQETPFPFNVIVVDNHSTDGTAAVLADLARQHAALRHVVPERTDLAIGGCWNEALRSPACGRYAVQLDSDDLYRDAHVLQRMVDLLEEGYAMVIGAYTLVDFDLNEIPPGLIDHSEWTDENGHNNALRVNGLGAPRAFSTALMRETGFLDVSYGEDYAAALRVCREYKVGRIYESLYLCRRWPGNTDAGLDLERANRNDLFKDEVRTDEITARQAMSREAADRP